MMVDEIKNETVSDGVPETVSDLADLKEIAGDAPQGDAIQIAARAEVPLREQELDAQGRAYATGRRKDAVARVWLTRSEERRVGNECGSTWRSRWAPLL